MKNAFHLLRKATIALGLLAAGSAAFAGTIGAGGVGYMPGALGAAAPIPTLSEWMLMSLALLLAVLAWRVLRARTGGRPLASVILCGALALGALSGNDLLRDARAMVATLTFSSPTGGSVTVQMLNTEYEITNVTTVPQQVVSVTPLLGNVAVPTTGSPQCAVGLVVAPTAKCFIRFVTSVSIS